MQSGSPAGRLESLVRADSRPSQEWSGTSCSPAARGMSCNSAGPDGRRGHAAAATAAVRCGTRRRAGPSTQGRSGCDNHGRTPPRCGTRRSRFRDRTTPERETARSSPGGSAWGFPSCDNRRRTGAHDNRRTTGTRSTPRRRASSGSCRYARERLPASRARCPWAPSGALTMSARASAGAATAHQPHCPGPVRAGGAAPPLHPGRCGRLCRIAGHDTPRSARRSVAPRRRGCARIPRRHDRQAQGTLARGPP